MEAAASNGISFETKCRWRTRSKKRARAASDGTCKWVAIDDYNLYASWLEVALEDQTRNAKGEADGRRFGAIPEAAHQHSDPVLRLQSASSTSSPTTSRPVAGSSTGRLRKRASTSHRSSLGRLEKRSLDVRRHHLHGPLVERSDETKLLHQPHRRLRAFVSSARPALERSTPTSASCTKSSRRAAQRRRLVADFLVEQF